MTEANYKKRVRINFSKSVKGIITPDVTVEMIDETNETVLAEAKKVFDEANTYAVNKSDTQ